MAITHYMKGPLLVIDLGEVFSAEDLQRFVEEMERLEQQLEVTPSRIVDMRRITQATVDFQALYSLAERRRTEQPKNPIRTAGVATSQVAIGYARMFQTLMANHPLVTLKLFETFEDAERWALSLRRPARRLNPSLRMPPTTAPAMAQKRL